MKSKIERLGKVSITVEKDYWDKNKTYNRLTIVERQGTRTAYLSRKVVPIGVEITDRNYWITISKWADIPYEIVQEFGDSPELVISQKVVTLKVNELQEFINSINEIIGEGGSIDERISIAKSDVKSELIDGASEEGDTLKKLEDRLSDVEESVGEGGSVDERIAEEGAKHYTKEETYNKTELNSLITTPNQKYVSVSATSQTTDITDVLPATGVANTVYRVGNWSGSQFDASVYSEYAWADNQYIHISTKTQIGEIFDISAYHATGGTLATYDDLEDALGTNGKNIPQSLKKGGMSVKFVQTSGNKYVRFNYLLKDATTNNKFTNVANWQGVDDEPTAGSDNLVKSGGVINYYNPNIAVTPLKYLNEDGSIGDTTVSSFGVSDYYFVAEGIEINNCRGGSTSNYTYLCFYDDKKQFLTSLQTNNTTPFTHTITKEEIPEGALYFRVTVNPTAQDTSINVPLGNVTNTINKKLLEGTTIIDLLEYRCLDKNGYIMEVSSNSFNITQFIIPRVGMILKNCHAAPSQNYIYAAFYDITGLCVGKLLSDSVSKLDHTLVESDIPSNASYMRVVFYKDGNIINKLDVTESDIKSDADMLYKQCSYPIAIKSKCILNTAGVVIETTVDNYNVTDYCFIRAGIRVVSVHPVAPQGYTYLCFYNAEFNFVGNLQATSNSLFTYVLQESDIPEGAVYFRATVGNSGYVDYRMSLADIPEISRLQGLDGLFDYENVLAQDKRTLRNIVESSSNGSCTVLWDDYGFPSLMYKIPKVSIGSLAPNLGEDTDIHPAFVVNGVEKDCIYVSVFQTSVYRNHYVSWYGLKPAGAIELPILRTGIAEKGNGWHLETIYERSLIVLLTMLLNSPQPTGNTDFGRSHIHTWESIQFANGHIPGVNYRAQGVGWQWINGTQPSAWSHNKEKWGIQDIIGGFHRICDLMKLVNGKIYIAPDNNFFKKGDDIATFENSWIDTGAAFDVINNNIFLNTSVTNLTTDPYLEKKYSNIRCTADYDGLPESTRKKLSLLLMAPRLSSLDSNTIFDIVGRFGIANHKPLCYGVFGGAEEYNNSGLGAQITGYPIDDKSIEGHSAHGNMGSRMVYIP